MLRESYSELKWNKMVIQNGKNEISLFGMSESMIRL